MKYKVSDIVRIHIITRNRERDFTAFIYSIDECSDNRVRIRYKYVQEDEILRGSVYYDDSTDSFYNILTSVTRMNTTFTLIDLDTWDRDIWKLLHPCYPMIDHANYIDRKEDPSWVFFTPITIYMGKSIGRESLVWYNDDEPTKEDSLGSIWELDRETGKVRMIHMKRSLNYNR